MILSYWLSFAVFFDNEIIYGDTDSDAGLLTKGSFNVINI